MTQGSGARLDAMTIKRIADKVPAFQGLTLGQIHKLIQVGEVIQEKRGEILCSEGDESTEMFILLSGELVVRSGAVELTFITTSEIVGEMSLITGLPRCATVEVMEDATLFMIRKEHFDTLLRENADLAARIYQNMLHSLCGKLRQTNVQLVRSLLAV